MSGEETKSEAIKDNSVAAKRITAALLLVICMMAVAV